MKVGDIVLCKVYFVEMNGNFKLRPVLLFKQMGNDFLFLPLTTNLNRNGYLITKGDLKEGKLIKNSIIVIPKFGVISKDFIVKRVDEIKKEKFNEIKKMVCLELNCFYKF